MLGIGQGFYEYFFLALDNSRHDHFFLTPLRPPVILTAFCCHKFLLYFAVIRRHTYPNIFSISALISGDRFQSQIGG